MSSTTSNGSGRFRGSTTTYILIGVAIIIVVAILLYFVPVSVAGQVTDAASGEALANVPVTLSNGQQVTSDASGSVVFYGPDGERGVLWMESGLGDRLAVRPTDPAPIAVTGVRDDPEAALAALLTALDAAGLIRDRPANEFWPLQRSVSRCMRTG